MLYVLFSIIGYGDPYSKTSVRLPFGLYRGEPIRLFQSNVRLHDLITFFHRF
jgi:hypothetical protein